MLYDRMVAFHVQRGVTVPMSAAEFYQGLEQRFLDGMVCTSCQIKLSNMIKTNKGDRDTRIKTFCI